MNIIFFLFLRTKEIKEFFIAKHFFFFAEKQNTIIKNSYRIDFRCPLEYTSYFSFFFK